jgi:alkanesulfonate monooxygenase SsuD/methylene tetrahydromethanopterin reductase-like flavin-dependent oxidoreductase (luciferase family)
VTAAGLNPLPVQRPIPIWIGGSAERAIKRAAFTADGFFPERPMEGGWPATLDKLRGWLAEAGRDPASFGIDARINAAVGTPEEWQRQAEQWLALGATHLTVATMRGGLPGPDAHVQRLEQAMQVLSGVAPAGSAR